MKLFQIRKTHRNGFELFSMKVFPLLHRVGSVARSGIFTFQFKYYFLVGIWTCHLLIIKNLIASPIILFWAAITNLKKRKKRKEAKFPDL